MKQYIYILLSVGIMTLMNSCNAFKNTDAKIAPEPTDISTTIYATSDMNEVTVKEGETFEITLDSNPSTGYAWEITEELDASNIEEIDNVYAAAENKQDPPLVGAGGKEVWTFKAIQKGTFEIKMKYCQGFNRDNPAEEKTIIVKVN